MNINPKLQEYNKKLTGLNKAKNRQVIIFSLEKRNGQHTLWQRIKGSDEQFKNDIDSILDERIQLYSKLFTSEEWDKNSGDELLSCVQEKLTDVAKNELAGDLTIQEIKKTVMSMK
jgi:hypothetical protein